MIRLRLPSLRRRRTGYGTPLNLSYNGPTGNPVHDALRPRCTRPLPHRHPVGCWDRDGFHPPPYEDDDRA